MAAPETKIHNPQGRWRVLVTKPLPGDRWLELLKQAGCRVEICTSRRLLTQAELSAAIGPKCDGVIGQLTETWGDALLSALAGAGGKIYSNYAVGYNNVDVQAATRHGIAVGNTPGVLTETTAEMAVALTFAAARRIGEAERFLRAGRYQGWLPDLFLGALLHGATVGVIGAGRIGSAYARMMVQGHLMNLVYYNRNGNPHLENSIAAFNRFLASQSKPPVRCQRARTVEDLLKISDVVSLHTAYSSATHHLINAPRLALMKPDAVLVNTSRGPVIDETALVTHCRRNPNFRAGLDVFENEPALAPGLSDLENVVLAPHIASATSWTRQNMAVLAAANAMGVLKGLPPGSQSTIDAITAGHYPDATPSIVNAQALGLNGGTA